MDIMVFCLGTYVQEYEGQISLFRHQRPPVLAAALGGRGERLFRRDSDAMGQDEFWLRWMLTDSHMRQTTYETNRIVE